MKAAGCALIFAVTLATARPTRAADDSTISLPDLIQGAQQWAQQNLDTNVLNALPEMDDQTAQQFFTEFERRYQGEFVIDLAELRETAQTVLPLLQSTDQTQPYAAWLSAQMDYLAVADQLRILVPPPPSSGTNFAPTNAPTVARTNPSPQLEREVWVKQIADSPWPQAAREYVPELKPVFAAQKVPPELVWVAEVESGFDRRALSPAGAAGMFQLMPETAKQYGLSLFPRDQRYQPEPSAAASAQYLKTLYDHFHDWRLALAAYNAGRGTVDKLVERYGTNNYDAIATHLPAETQMYVPRVEAVLLKREDARLEELPAPN